MVILWFFLLIPLMIGRPLGAEASAYITFTLFEAAYYAEIMRAGIQSVPKGQQAAAQAVSGSLRAQELRAQRQEAARQAAWLDVRAGMGS